MKTLENLTEKQFCREVKKFKRENEFKNTSIEVLGLSDKMFSITNKHAMYYCPESQTHKHIPEPITATFKINQ